MVDGTLISNPSIEIQCLQVLVTLANGKDENINARTESVQYS